MSKKYPGYDWLHFSEPAPGVLQITMPAGTTKGSVDEARHNELSRIWLDADDDDTVRAILLTGEGGSFSAGGDFE
ncbi:MAG: enoyl-CoA hydratase-related protein, partial [Alphaproteobacteria bacterium]|nr:enoyl-CoA hydratase-related protein [Alphaproteobacteria bacterium]